jgi:cadmium resistance protein CadD (predicted permease)
LDVPALVGIGIAAFVSTNIDGLFILMVFFATPRFPSYQIVLGQYIGMGSLMGVSLVGSLIALVLPRYLIGLIGLFPIAVGIKESWNHISWIVEKITRNYSKGYEPKKYNYPC